jgi:hypothetical protein
LGAYATSPPVVAQHINSSKYDNISGHAVQDAIEGVLDRRPAGVSAPQLASLFSSPDTAARLQAALQVSETPHRVLCSLSQCAQPPPGAASS